MTVAGQELELPDGRVLGFDEYGARDGTPLFYFHGTPGARLEWHLFGGENAAQRLGLRIIAVDRPGMGLSTFQPGRRITDWPADVRAVADALQLGTFAVLGCSGDGARLACFPRAAAAAWSAADSSCGAWRC